jgi:TolB-like protein/Flp pilus assembly protein TadD
LAQPADVFISYSREDKDRVLELAGKLRAAGVSLWIDQGGIDGATLWGEEIVNALDHAKVLLLAVTASAARSHNVAKEVVLFSERKGHILPVHLEQTVIPPGLKYPLAGIQHIEYFSGDADENLKTILRSLERAGATITPPKPAATAAAGATSEGRRAPSPPAQAGHADQHIERGALAVLPFENISTDQETDYFSDGLTEELIARLSLVSEIELVSRWATVQYKGRKQDIHAIGNELGARYIVGGSVRRFQDLVRITVQLVDVGTNRQIWGNTYKGKLDDIFDIQEQVAQQIVEALKLKLSFSEKVSLTKRHTGNAQAYDLYLRGQAYLYRLSKRGTEYAIQLFEKAIELDPRFAAAYAGCSCAYGQMYGWFSREEKYRDKAQEFSFKALMYDNSLPEAYTAMGLSYLVWGKFDEAVASASKAIELDPDDFIARWTLGRIQFSTGHAEQAVAHFEQVIALRPTFYTGYSDLCQTLDSLNRAEEAKAVAQRMVEMMPTYLLQNPDDARGRMVYAHMLNTTGKRDLAISESQAAIEAAPGDSVMLYNAACLYSKLGERKRAIDTLRQAINAGVQNYAWMKHDPDLNPLRDEPEFIEMTRENPSPA